jgi:hypothetical protein
MIKYSGVNFANSSSHWKLESIQGSAALTNKNRENYDKIHAVNLVVFAFTVRKI